MARFYLCLQLCIFCIAIAACQTTQQRPTSLSKYDNTTAPARVDDWVLVDTKIYPDPLAGVGYSYKDERNPTDIISCYIYPIPQIEWDEEIDQAQREELTSALTEIDYAVQLGKYKSRTQEVISAFKFSHDAQQYLGKKARLTMVNESGRDFDSEIFIFSEKDKFIKFRVSFDKEITPDWTGDKIVKAILPKLNVPGESDYMMQLRAKAKEKRSEAIKQALQQAIMQASQNTGLDVSIKKDEAVESK